MTQEKWVVRGHGIRIQKREMLARHVPRCPRKRALIGQVTQLADWWNVIH